MVNSPGPSPGPSRGPSAALELSRPVVVDRLGRDPVEIEVTADPESCARIASRLRLPALRALVARFTLVRDASSVAAPVIEADATLEAVVVHDCVVTLEPFEARVTERFRLRFVPDDGRAGEDEIDADPDSIDEIPYACRTIDLGEAAVEQLALALDPFPRKPGAVLEAAAGDEAADEADDPAQDPGHVSPFAVLARRRPN